MTSSGTRRNMSAVVRVSCLRSRLHAAASEQQHSAASARLHPPRQRVPAQHAANEAHGDLNLSVQELAAHLYTAAGSAPGRHISRLRAARTQKWCASFLMATQKPPSIVAHSARDIFARPPSLAGTDATHVATVLVICVASCTRPTSSPWADLSARAASARASVRSSMSTCRRQPTAAGRSAAASAGAK